MAQAGSVYPTYLTADLDPRARAAFSEYARMAENTFSRAERAASESAAKIGAAQAAAMQRAGMAAGASAAAGGVARQGISAAGLVGPQDTRRVDGMASSVRGLRHETGAATNALHGMATGLGVVQGPLGPVAGRVNALAAAFRHMRNSVAIGSALGVGSVVGIATIANEYQNVQNRLRPLYASQTQFNIAFNQVTRIAQVTRQSLDDVAVLYQRLTLAGQGLGKTQGMIANETGLVSKAIRLSAANLQQTQAAITQYAQGVGSGRGLGGDELRSIQENAPRLAQAIADGMGVTIGALKQMGSEGVLTAQLIGTALQNQADIINREFERMPMTVGQSLTLLTNNSMILAGRLDEAMGVSKAAATAIAALAGNLDIAAAAVLGLAAAFAGPRLIGAVAGLVNGLRASAEIGRVFKALNQDMAAEAANAARAQAAQAAQTEAALRRELALVESQIATYRAKRDVAAQAAATALNASQGGGSAGFTSRSAIMAGDETRKSTQYNQQLIAAQERRSGVARQLAAATDALTTATNNEAAAAQKAATGARGMAGAFTFLRGVVAGFASFLNPVALAVGALTAAVVYYAGRQSDAEAATDNAARALENYGALVDQTTGKLVRMSETRRKTLELEGRAEYQRTGARGGDIQRGLAAELRETAVNVTRFRNMGGTTGDAAARARYENLARGLEAGGAASIAAQEKIRQLAATGDEIAARFLRRTQETRKELGALAQSQVAARDKVRLATGGIDPAFAENQANAAAQEAAERQKRLDDLDKQIEQANKQNDELNALVRGRDLAYSAMSPGGNDIRETIRKQEVALANLRRQRVAPGQEEARAGTLQRMSDSIARMRSEEEKMRPEVERRAKAYQDSAMALSRANDAAAKQRKEDAAARKAAREAERLRKQAEREERAREQEYGRFLGVTARYDQEPRRIDRAQADIRYLENLTRNQTKLQDDEGGIFTIDQVRLGEEILRIRRELDRPRREMFEEMERENLLLAMTISGREDEARLLQERVRFLRDGVELSAGDQQRYIGLLNQRREMEQAEQLRQRLVDTYRGVAQDFQRSFEDAWENLTERGIKSFKDIWKAALSGFSRLQAQMLSEGLFGGLGDQMEESVTGRPPTNRQPYQGFSPTSGNFFDRMGQMFGVQRRPAGQASSQQPTRADIDRQVEATLEAARGTEKTADAVQAIGGDVRSGTGMLQHLVTGIDAAAAASMATAAGVQAMAASDAALANSAGGTVAGRRMSPVETFNRIGRDMGDKLDRLFGTTRGPIKGQMGSGTGWFGTAGKALGSGLQGYGIASMITETLGIGGTAGRALKGMGTGASMGMQIGGPVGAGIGAAAGLLAGAVSGLLKKTSKSSATVGFGGGEYGVGTVTGTSRSRKEAAEALGEGLGGYLTRIAETLGGAVRDVGNISIGTRDKTFRVDPTGQGRTKGMAEFKSEEDAIREAIRIMLERGVIDGISDASKRILAKGKDLERAIEKAGLIEDIPRRIKRIMNPMGAAVDDLNREFTQLRDVLVEGGASAAQFAELQQLYDLERANALKQQEREIEQVNDMLTDFLKDIIGGSDSPLSPRERVAEAEREYASQVGSIGTATFDQDAFMEAARNFQDAARDMYGSTPQFFERYNRIVGDTRNAIAGLSALQKVPEQQQPTGPIAASPFSDPNWMKPINDTMAVNTRAITTQTQVLADAIYSLAPDFSAAIQNALSNLFTGGGGALAALPTSTPVTVSAPVNTYYGGAGGYGLRAERGRTVEL